ncbi:MAG: hypothetical protein HN849_01750 [Victivallales bacterium]|jgi:hypothetical protein|nr:hypothetical protein [Victivallales bacterium]MBT7162667.1 hypothetical protein [Victivallales bacterium]MBT7298202.1 hypothetical protein [Victivallales bacterium]
MRRQIIWKEDTDEGRTEIRVTLMKQEIKWQYKPKGRGWDYDTPPSDERWDRLEQELKDRMQRGNTAAYEALKRVQKLRRGDP